MSRFAAGSLLALIVLAGPVQAKPVKPAEPAAAPPSVISGAVLQGLDKTTARVTQFDAPLGQSVSFGQLRVIVRDCRKHPPEETPESAAYLDIVETVPGESTPRPVFKGWMFASSPALSAIQNPVYDVWVLDCKMSSGSPAK